MTAPWSEVPVPTGAMPVGTPPLGWKLPYGRVETVGDLRKIIETMADDTPLLVRNGPLPFFSFFFTCGRGHLEFECDITRKETP